MPTACLKELLLKSSTCTLPATLTTQKNPLRVLSGPTSLGGTHASVPQKRTPCRKLSCSDGNFFFAGSRDLASPLKTPENTTLVAPRLTKLAFNYLACPRLHHLLRGFVMLSLLRHTKRVEDFIVFGLCGIVLYFRIVCGLDVNHIWPRDI